MARYDALILGAGLLAGSSVVLSATQQGASRAPAAATAFVDVAVIPMDSQRVLTRQTVLVRGDRIAAIGPVGRVEVPMGAVQVDGKGKFLLPGLADMHSHFATQNDEGYVLNPTVGARAMLLDFLAYGITTVRDMHSGPSNTGVAWMPALRQRIAAGELLGPRIYATGDPDKGGKLEGWAKSIEALKAAGYDFVKLYANERPDYDSIVMVARRVGLPVVGHIPFEVGLTGVLADRWASIEHLTNYAEYGKTLAKLEPEDSDSLVPEATIREMAAATRQAGVWNCPTLTRIEVLASSSDRPFVFWRRMVKALQDAGAGLLLGSDAAFKGVTDDYYPLGGEGAHRELEALVAAGLTPYQALEAGTRNVARFLGTEDSTGTVAVGKRADLILLNANPLANIRHSTALAGVMLGGRWLPKAELDRLLAAALAAAGNP